MVLSDPKVKSLNKEIVSQALLDNFDFSPELVCEIVECVWRSNEAVEQSVQTDWLPCGHHKDAIVGNGRDQWCVACEAANR